MGFSAIKRMDLRMPLVRWRHYFKIGLKQPMTENAQRGKHRSAKDNGIEQGSAGHILYDIEKAGPDKHIPNRLNQARPLIGVTVPLGEIGICLTRGRSVNGIERPNEFRIQSEGIRLNKWKRIIRLRLNIHAYNLKARLTVTDTRAARAAEKV